MTCVENLQNIDLKFENYLQAQNFFKAVLIDLWPYLFTPQLSKVQLYKKGILLEGYKYFWPWESRKYFYFRVIFSLGNLGVWAAWSFGNLDFGQLGL